MGDDREGFAAKALGVLQRAGLRGCRYQPDDFAIATEAGLLNLAHVFAEYQGASFFGKGKVLERWVAAVQQMADPLPKSIDQARANILPTVRERAFYENLELSDRASAIKRSPSPIEALGGGLVMSLVYDRQATIVGLASGQLEEWEISLHEAMQIARLNIRMRSPAGLAEVAPGLHVSPYRDNHDCARVVLTEVISRLPLRGDPVALIPHRDTLIVTGSEDDANLVKAAEMALQQIGDSRSVSGRAICFRSGSWHAFMPPPESPAHEPFRELGLKGQWGLYEVQRQALQKLEGDQVFIGIFEVKLWKETNRWFSYAVWGDGIPTWMPIAENVYFFSERTGQKVIRGPWDWDAVHKVAGALMHPKDCVPARVFVQRFPTDDMLDEIERSLS